jgi:hypothetical protein
MNNNMIMSVSTDVNVAQFTEMTGASRETAQHYVNLAGGNMEHAVTLYFESGGAPPPQPEPQAPAVHWTAGKVALNEASISQFTFPEGRSACTVIACEASFALLNMKKPLVEATKEMVVSTVHGGIEEYKARQKGPSGGVEHMSCDEVLLSCPKYSEVMEASGFQQGTNFGSRAFEREIDAALDTAQRFPNGICAVITKPPETVVVHVLAGATPSFVVFDSHPRQDIGIHGAYTQGFNTAAACASYLRQIFPSVDGLGDGMMEQMYNSFDMNLLSRKPNIVLEGETNDGGEHRRTEIPTEPKKTDKDDVVPKPAQEAVLESESPEETISPAEEASGEHRRTEIPAEPKKTGTDDVAPKPAQEAVLESGSPEETISPAEETSSDASEKKRKRNDPVPAFPVDDMSRNDERISAPFITTSKGAPGKKKGKMKAAESSSGFSWFCCANSR